MSYVEKLQNCFKDKRVVLMANSPSMEYWVDRRDIFKDKDYKFACNNWWMPIEDDLLKPVGQSFDLIVLGEHRAYHEANLEFVKRPNSLLFVTTPSPDLVKKQSKYAPMVKRIKKYYKGTNVMLTELELVKRFTKFKPNRPLMYPNLDTIQILTIMATLGRAKDIFILGADGGVTPEFAKYSKGKCHYKCECSAKRNYVKSVKCYDSLTKSIISDAKRAFRIPSIPTYIVGSQSNYNFCDKMDKDHAEKVLRDG